MTKKELKQKIEALGELKHDQKMSIICSLIGHSNICTAFFGYRYCGRCGDQLGDSLGSVDYFAKQAVLVGHKCDTCIENYKDSTWKDKLYTKDPFKYESILDDEYKDAPFLMEL